LVRVAASHAATLALAVLIGGFGLADGGPPQFTSAFLQYAPAVAVWSIYSCPIDAYSSEVNPPAGFALSATTTATCNRNDTSSPDRRVPNRRRCPLRNSPLAVVRTP
jgi:hypothetical protein